MNLVLVKPSATEPLSLTELRSYLRLDDGLTDDAYLEALITAAREYCESFQNRAFITQTWQLSFHYWPAEVIQIPSGNLQKINSIGYKNSSGGITTLTENTHYVVSNRGVLGTVAPVFGQPWPPFVPWPLDAVVIEFACGYGDTADSVPEKVKQAMKLLVSHWYENRIPLSETGQVPGEIAFTVSAILWQDRIIPT
ncbi:head-tail connector protein [Paradesulfitobacterium aromaticivorans]